MKHWLQWKIQLARLRHRLRAKPRCLRWILAFVLPVLLTLTLLSVFGPQRCSCLISGNQAIYANLPILMNRDPVKIHVIDVGQGDSTLIEFQDQRILIDCGPPECSLTLKRYLQDLGIHSLDLLILTHPHDDHLGGARMVLDNFEVKQVMLPHDLAGNDLLADIRQHLEDCRIPVIHPHRGMKLEQADWSMTCLHPLLKSYENPNNYSSVWLMQYQNIRCLFLADLEKDEFSQIPDIPVDFLRAGHHGSATSCTPILLKKLNPLVIGISCGVNNPFGHPSPEVLAMIREQNLSSFRTDLQGTKVLSSDGIFLRWVH